MENANKNWVYYVALACFLLSGAAGLVYEVVWTRMLAQIFGNTTYAVATVLAAFMAGLAFGSYLFGRLADRGKNGFQLYGILEACVGLYGLLVPWLFRAGRELYVPMFFISESFPAVFNVLLFFLAFLLLAFPAMLMGATLPVLSRALVSDLADIGRRVGNLYAANTLGAVLGTAAAGYYLVEAFGMATTIYLAASVNLLIALIIFVTDRIRTKARVTLAPPVPTTAQTTPTTGVSWLGAILLAGFGLSGFCALVYQNSWSRILTLVIGTSVYSFTTMLVTFLAGLALGGFIYARLFGRRSARLSGFGAVELAIGVTALATLPLFERLPLLFLRLIEIFGDSFPLFVSSQLLLCALVILVPTVLFGATFPMVVKIFTQDLYRVGSGVGTSYAANTLGAIFGAFAGGFVLIPTLGIQQTLILAALINLLVGAAMVLADTQVRAPLRYGVAAATVLALIFLPIGILRWDPAVLTSGVTLYHHVYRTLPTDTLRLEKIRRDDVVYYREGPTATISVHKNPPATDAQRALGIPANSYTVRTNGKIDGSHNDALTQLLIGYIPMILKPDAKSAAVIGLGTGMTAKAVATFPIKTLDILEIEPAMVEASTYFDDANGKVLADPRVRLVISDARNYLSATARKYDLITSEPSNPWIAGIANLYTVDFYERIRSKLTENGIFAQWFHDYSMSPTDLRMVLNSFAKGFHHVSVWELHRKDFLLVGSNHKQVFDYPQVERMFRSNEVFRTDLEGLGLSNVYAILGFYRLGREEILAFAGNAQVNTDDGAQLEFSAPRSLLMNTSDLNQELMKPFLSQPPWLKQASEWGLSESSRRYYLAQGLHASGANENALQEVTAAIEEDPTEAGFSLLKAKILLALHRPGPALRAGLDAVDLSEKVLPELLALSGGFEHPRARELIYRKAVELGSNDVRPYAGLGTLTMLMGAPEDADGWLDEARRLAPDDPAVLEARGLMMVARSQPEQAKRLLERAREQGRDTVLLHGALGDAYTALELWEPAAAAYRQALRHDIRNTDWRRSLGIALARLGQIDAAEREFRDVLALRSDDALAWAELEKMGRPY